MNPLRAHGIEPQLGVRGHPLEGSCQYAHPSGNTFHALPRSSRSPLWSGSASLFSFRWRQLLLLSRTSHPSGSRPWEERIRPPPPRPWPSYGPRKPSVPDRVHGRGSDEVAPARVHPLAGSWPGRPRFSPASRETTDLGGTAANQIWWLSATPFCSSLSQPLWNGPPPAKSRG